MRRTMTTMRPAAPSWGSRLILYGALALILASGYALYVQVDTSQAWLRAIINSNHAMGTSAVQQLLIMFQTTPQLRLLASQMLFLLALCIIAVIVIGQRRRTGVCIVMLPVCALCYWVGCTLTLYSTDLSDLLRLLYVAPLAVIAIGCILQLVHRIHLGREARPHYRPPAIRPKDRYPQPVQRTTPERERQYRDMPGATRMLPNIPNAAPTQPARQRRAPVTQQKPAAQRQEQPIPDRSATHIGEPPMTPAQQPRYQWKTIKQSDRKDVIGQ